MKRKGDKEGVWGRERGREAGERENPPHRFPGVYLHETCEIQGGQQGSRAAGSSGCWGYEQPGEQQEAGPTSSLRVIQGHALLSSFPQSAPHHLI